MQEALAGLVAMLWAFFCYSPLPPSGSSYRDRTEVLQRTEWRPLSPSRGWGLQRSHCSLWDQAMCWGEPS